MKKTGKVINAMISYYAGDVRRINHFFKVHGFAKAIGEMEGIDEDLQQILEIAALTHDIGIKNSEKKYDSCAGNYQQIEGPPEAKRMLEGLGFDKTLIERVCWLIAHHHTYNNVNEIDYQILIEADFLVNAFEGELSLKAIKNMQEKIFKTKTGISFLNKLYQ